MRYIYVENHTCLFDICQNENDYVQYFSLASNATLPDKKINLYFPFEFSFQSQEKSYSKIFYLKLKSVKQINITDYQYSAPVGIFIGEDINAIIKPLLKTISKNNMYRAISNRNIEDTPNIPDLSFLYSNENMVVKKSILLLKNSFEKLHENSKNPTFNREHEINYMAEKLAESNLKNVENIQMFLENDFDCSEVLNYCQKNELVMLKSWSPIRENDRDHYITAKKLYIKNCNILQKNIHNTDKELENIILSKDKGKNIDKNIAMLDAGIRICIEHIGSIKKINAAKLTQYFKAALNQDKYRDLTGYFRAKEKMENKQEVQIEKGALLETYTKKPRPLNFYKEYIDKIKSEAILRNSKQGGDDNKSSR